MHYDPALQARTQRIFATMDSQIEEWRRRFGKPLTSDCRRTHEASAPAAGSPPSENVPGMRDELAELRRDTSELRSQVRSSAATAASVVDTVRAQQKALDELRTVTTHLQLELQDAKKRLDAAERLLVLRNQESSREQLLRSADRGQVVLSVSELIGILSNPSHERQAGALARDVASAVTSLPASDMDVRVQLLERKLEEERSSRDSLVQSAVAQAVDALKLQLLASELQPSRTAESRRSDAGGPFTTQERDAGVDDDGQTATRAVQARESKALAELKQRAEDEAEAERKRLMKLLNAQRALEEEDQDRQRKERMLLEWRQHQQRFERQFFSLEATEFRQRGMILDDEETNTLDIQASFMLGQQELRSRQIAGLDANDNAPEANSATRFRFRIDGGDGGVDPSEFEADVTENEDKDDRGDSVHAEDRSQRAEDSSAQGEVQATAAPLDAEDAAKHEDAHQNNTFAITATASASMRGTTLNRLLLNPFDEFSDDEPSGGTTPVSAKKGSIASAMSPIATHAAGKRPAGVPPLVALKRAEPPLPRSLGFDDDDFEF
jgi:hypothetical protein